MVWMLQSCNREEKWDDQGMWREGYLGGREEGEKKKVRQDQVLEGKGKRYRGSGNKNM